MPKRKFKREVLETVVLIKKYIDEHPGNGISTARLAREHNLSRNVLQEAFKFKFNKPIGRYKLKKRLQEGRRLLKTGQSIKEVSFKLGYSSPSTFSDAFKSFFKKSPSEWLQESAYTGTNKTNCDNKE